MLKHECKRPTENRVSEIVMTAYTKENCYWLEIPPLIIFQVVYCPWCGKQAKELDYCLCLSQLDSTIYCCSCRQAICMQCSNLDSEESGRYCFKCLIKMEETRVQSKTKFIDSMMGELQALIDKNKKLIKQQDIEDHTCKICRGHTEHVGHICHQCHSKIKKSIGLE
jgi:hypothetical protein